MQPHWFGLRYEISERGPERVSHTFQDVELMQVLSCFHSSVVGTAEPCPLRHIFGRVL
jgi:hypothetical protein